MKLKTDLLKTSTSITFIHIVNMGLMFFGGIILARFLGPKGYGHYAYSLSVINVFAVPFMSGMQNLVIRVVASNSHNKKNIFVYPIIIIVLFFLVVTILIMLSLTVFDEWIVHNFIITFSCSLLLIVLIPVNGLFEGIYRGFNKSVISVVGPLLLKPTAVLVFIIVAIRMNNLTSYYAVVFQIIGTIVSIIFFIILMFFSKINVKNSESQRLSTWLKSLLPFIFLGSLQIINQQTDIIMLGLYLNSEMVGIYKAMVQISSIVSLILIGFNIVIGPLTAKFYNEGILHVLQKEINRGMKYIFVVAVPIFVFYILFSFRMVRILFGIEYIEGVTALKILVIGQMFNVLAGPVATILNMTHNEKKSLFGLSISAIANILLNSLLIPIFGINGAAVATATSFILWNFILILLLYKAENIVSTPLLFFLNRKLK